MDNQNVDKKMINSPTKQKEDSYFYNYETNEINVVNLFGVIFLVILVVLIISYLGSGNNDSSSSGNSGYNDSSSSGSGGSMVFWIILMVILLFVIYIYFYLTYYDISIDTYISNLFGNSANIDVVIDDKNKIIEKPIPPTVEYMKKEVFNIPNNNYTYDEARALCKAYDSDLATYKQVEDAYENGGEWCRYGWSEDQLALFPTQEKTYNNLQKIKGHEYSCGRPGVNGGYFEDKNMKFGVNCYGYKPKITEQEAEYMKIMSPYPETKEDAEFQKNVEKMKQNVDDILLSPFNYTNWHQA